MSKVLLNTRKPPFRRSKRKSPQVLYKTIPICKRNICIVYMSETSDLTESITLGENVKTISLDANYTLAKAMNEVESGNIIKLAYGLYYRVIKASTPTLTKSFPKNVKIGLGGYKVANVRLFVGEMVDKPYFLKSTFQSKSPKQYGAVVCVKTEKAIGERTKYDYIINVTEPFYNVDETVENYKWRTHPSYTLFSKVFSRKGGKKTKAKKTKKTKKTKHLRKSKRK